MSDKKWYIVYVGNPRKIDSVRTVFNETVGDFTMWIPTQEVVQRINGDVNTSARALFPGYVLVNFVHEGSGIDDQLYEVKAGFLLKAAGSNVPAFLTDEDVEIIKIHEKEKVDEEAVSGILVKIGSFVELTNGPFIGARGTVTGVKKDKVSVELVIFGRFVPVEISDKFLRYVPSDTEKAELEAAALASRREQTKQHIERLQKKNG